MSAEILAPIEARLVHAEKQAAELIPTIREWAERHPLQGTGSLLPDRLGYEIRLTSVDQTSVDQFGFPVGDCVHNLRSTLDNLAFALVKLRSDPPQAPKDIHFPLYITERDFNKNAKRMLEQVRPLVAYTLGAIQPFQRQGRVQNGVSEGMPKDDPLVLLHRINVGDKHHVPVQVTISPSTLTFKGNVKFASSEDADRNIPPDTEIMLPLRVGDVFFRHRTVTPLVSVNNNFEITGDIALVAGDETVPVGPILVKFCEHVRLVLDRFRGFFS